jgi:deazaflavin-dependent oxidoreductase (nitroreductase family)
MTIEGDYAPSTAKWVRDHVEGIETRGTTEGTTIRSRPVVMLTMRGAKSGKIRKVPLMRVEHDGSYAAVASLGGAEKNPVWYYNLVADPRVDLQDADVTLTYTAREITGDERETWWERAVAAYPDYADYQLKCERTIPVFVLERAV